MKKFKADLHIHTVLSPCASLDMSPKNIVEQALNAGLDIIAITDHNSTKQSTIIRDLAEKEGLFVICGAEVSTKEEVHCLALFGDDNELNQFQDYLDVHLVCIKNDSDKFGFQVVVDENENILETEERLLISSLDVGIIDVEKKVHELNGLFIPAHIERNYNGIISQLGFIPVNLTVDAVEFSKKENVKEFYKNKKIPGNLGWIYSSDAHIPEFIGKSQTIFCIETASFSEIKKAILGKEGRSISIE